MLLNQALMHGKLVSLRFVCGSMHWLWDIMRRNKHHQECFTACLDLQMKNDSSKILMSRIQKLVGTKHGRGQTSFWFSSELYLAHKDLTGSLQNIYQTSRVSGETTWKLNVLMIVALTNAHMARSHQTVWSNSSFSTSCFRKTGCS
jgi:hypothetical protein